MNSRLQRRLQLRYFPNFIKKVCYLLFALLLLLPCIRSDSKIYNPQCAYTNFNRFDPKFHIFCSFEDFYFSKLRFRLPDHAIQLSESGPKQVNINGPKKLNDAYYLFPDGSKVLIDSSLGKKFVPPNGAASKSMTREKLFKFLARFTDEISENSFFGWQRKANLVDHNEKCELMPGNDKKSLNILIDEFNFSACLAFPRTAKFHKHKFAIIYLEGHGGSALKLAPDLIRDLLNLDAPVVTLDMIGIGSNYVSGFPSHNSLPMFEFTRRKSSIALFFAPLDTLINQIQKSYGIRKFILIGRSGGGWLAYTYGALSSKIDGVVAIAGGWPKSERLAAPSGPYEVGDFEQFEPFLYKATPHAALMANTGNNWSAFVFNERDPCCFRANEKAEFIHWLKANSVHGPRTQVFIDKHNTEHSLGADMSEKVFDMIRQQIKEGDGS